MKPEDVPDVLVEKAAQEMRFRPDGTEFLLPMYRDLARHALAAVLPVHTAHIAALASLIASVLNLAADATEIEYGAPFTWEEVAKKRGRALDEISDLIIAFEPSAEVAHLTATERTLHMKAAPTDTGWLKVESSGSNGEPPREVSP